MADGAAPEDRAARLLRLRAEAEDLEAQAASAVTPEDEEEQALVERAEAARLKIEGARVTKLRAEASRQRDIFRKAAGGAYVVDLCDLEDDSPGAGVYVIRSPTKEAWKEFQERIRAAGDNYEKEQMAYNNLAAACVLWPASSSTDAREAWKAKYPVGVQHIADAAGRLGGVAAQKRKR